MASTPKSSANSSRTIMLASIAVGILLTVIIWPLSMIGKGDPSAESPDEAELRIQPVARVELKKAVAPSDGKPRSAEAVYNAICKACHDTGVAGAPKTGDKAAWAPRIALGDSALLQSVINGKGAMPARAGDASLTEDELKAAVAFLVGRAK